MGFPDKQYLFQDFTGESSLRQPFSPVNYTGIPAVPSSSNPATLGTISRTIFGEIYRLKFYTPRALKSKGSGPQGPGVLPKNQSKTNLPDDPCHLEVKLFQKIFLYKISRKIQGFRGPRSGNPRILGRGNETYFSIRPTRILQ